MPPFRTVTATCAATFAAAAPAAASWSEPAAVDAPGHPQLQRVSVLHGSGAGGVLSYGLGFDGGRVVQPLRAPGGLAGTPRVVRSLVVGPLPYGSSRTVSIRRRGDVLGYSFGRANGEVGRFRTLARVGFLRSIDAAVSPSGDVIVAWVDRDRGVHVSRRPAGSGRFTAPSVVRGSGLMSSVAVSVNGGRRFVVAWARSASARGRAAGTVEARLGGIATGVRGLQELGPSRGVDAIDAVVARTGRATVAWRTHDGGEELNGPVVVRAAVAPADSASFRENQLVAQSLPGAELPDGDLSVAADAGGRTTLAYDLSGSFTGGDERTPVQVATQGAGTRFDTVTELVADGVAGAVAVRADGTTIVPVVVQTEDPSSRNAPVTAFVRLPGTFGFAPEIVAAGGGHAPAAAGFEPGAAGRPAVFFGAITSGGDVLPRFSIRSG